jgi:hypothetical protein
VALGWLWGAYQLAINRLWGGFDVALGGFPRWERSFTPMKADSVARLSLKVSAVTPASRYQAQTGDQRGQEEKF